MDFVIQTAIRLPSLTKITKMLVSHPVLKDISDELVAQTKKNILTQGGVWGKWKPMAANTRYKNMVFGKQQKLLRGLDQYIFGRQTAVTASVAANNEIVKMHHEGRDFWWIIAAKPGKKLFFPMVPTRSGFGVTAGGMKLKSPDKAFKKGAKASYRISSKGKAYQTAYLKGKGGRFVSPYKYNDRRYNFVTLSAVYHKGYPARQIFPTPQQAAVIARSVADRWIVAMKREG